MTEIERKVPSGDFDLHTAETLDYIANTPQAKREVLAEEATIEAKTGYTPPALAAARRSYWGE